MRVNETENSYEEISEYVSADQTVTAGFDVTILEDRGEIAAASANDNAEIITLDADGIPTTTPDYFNSFSWRMDLTYPEEYTNPYYIFQLMRLDPDLKGGSETLVDQKTSSNVLTYTFPYSGTYKLKIFAIPTASSTNAFAYAEETVTVSDPDHPGMDELASQIVEECSGDTSDFGLALALHDYLINHAKYDNNYHYYNIDGVLLYGVGTCDSYVKAYQKLCKKAGLECLFVTGKSQYITSGNHSWNAVKIDGEWTWIDVTWDDPNNTEETVSGLERHFYFGFPDEVFLIDHLPEHFYDQNGAEVEAIDCPGHSNNYFIRTNRLINSWCYNLQRQIINSLNEGKYKFHANAPKSFNIERTGYTSSSFGYIPYGLANCVLRDKDYLLSEGESVKLLSGGYVQTDVFTVGSASYKGYIEFTVDCGDAVFATPDELLEIEADVFSGNEAVMDVELNDGVKKIGANAFSDCTRLWSVYVPESVDDIDDSAFDRCSHVTIEGKDGSYAQQFAEDHSLNFLNL